MMKLFPGIDEKKIFPLPWRELSTTGLRGSVSLPAIKLKRSFYNA